MEVEYFKQRTFLIFALFRHSKWSAAAAAVICFQDTY